MTCSHFKKQKQMNSFLSILLLLTVWSASAVAQQSDTLTVRIKGMRCDECAHKVMTKVMENKGVDDITFNIERRTATIVYDKLKTNADEIQAPLKGTRYNPTSYSTDDVIMRGFGQRMAELRSEADAQRAIEALQGRVGIDSLAPHVKKNYLFIRYDANRTDRAGIRKALVDAGFTPSNYYTGPKIAYANFNIPADKLHAVSVDDFMALDGVEDACINMRRATVAITYFNDETTAHKLTAAVSALGATP